jgi:hypothetical protein
MKRIALILLLVSFAYPQNRAVKSFVLKYANTQNGTQLNGTNQYWAKESPSSFNLNGAEMFSNTTFEVDVNGWNGLNGGTIARNTVIKRTGSGSMRVTSNGTGTSGVQLGAAINNTTTNKFTFEFWIYIPAASSSKSMIARVTNQALSGIGSFTAITPTADTWTKVVVNVQAPGTQTGISVYIAFNGASTSGDIFYIDDASMSQSFDVAWGGFIKTTATGVQTICLSALSSSLRTSMFLDNNTATVSISDGVTTVSATNSATVNDGRLHSFWATASRNGNLTLYVDGVAGTGVSILAVGAIAIDSLYVGRGLTGSFFNGQISSRQRVVFSSLPSGIASTISQISQQKKLFPAYESGNIIAWYDWQSGGFDKSGKGNHLVKVNNPIIVKVKQ